MSLSLSFTPFLSVSLSLSLSIVASSWIGSAVLFVFSSKTEGTCRSTDVDSDSDVAASAPQRKTRRRKSCRQARGRLPRLRVRQPPACRPRRAPPPARASSGRRLAHSVADAKHARHVVPLTHGRHVVPLNVATASSALASVELRARSPTKHRFGCRMRQPRRQRKATPACGDAARASCRRRGPPRHVRLL